MAIYIRKHNYSLCMLSNELHTYSNTLKFWTSTGYILVMRAV